MDVPTKVEIVEAAARAGVAIPANHIILDRIQHAYRRVEDRGGIEKIGRDIDARIAAAKRRQLSR